MRYSVSVLFVLAMIVLAGCSASEPEPTPTPGPPTNTPIPTNTPLPPTETPVPEIEVVGEPERGREIFENGGENEATTASKTLCAACHTYDGSDEKTHAGPDLKGISERAGQTVPGLSAAQYIYQSIMDPRAYIVEN